jgi:tetratricopeptide (TPR) repeat protein
MISPQSVLSQALTSESPPDSSRAPVKEEPSEHLNAKIDGVNQAPSITPSKPDKSALISQANETSGFQTAQKIQETSPIRKSPPQTEKTAVRPDASPIRESPISPGSPHPEDVPKKTVIVHKESTKYGSKESAVATQTASAVIKDSQGEYRDESDALKNTASGGPSERPRQTNERQEESENLLASKTPSLSGLTRKEESDLAINPNTLEAREWLKKSNDSISKNDPLETIVTASVAIKLDPKLLQAYVNRAWAFNERALYDKAILDLNQALQINPGNAFVYSSRALIFQRQGDDRKAVSDYEKACQLGLEIACENYQKFASLLRD